MKPLFSIAFALVVTAAGAVAQTPQPAPDPVAAGQAIAFDKTKGNCLACHQIAGGQMAGNVGPALKNMKLIMPDPRTLYAIIYDEPARNPQTVMPPFGRNGILTPDEIKDIVAFLYTK